MKLFGKSRKNEWKSNLAQAQAALQKNAPDNAKLFAEKALSEMDQSKDAGKPDRSWALFIIGTSDLALGNREVAEASFHKSVNLMEETYDPISVDQRVSTYLGLGRIQFQKKQY